MILEKPPLFKSQKEFGIVAGILLSIILFRLLILYTQYHEFISKPFYYTQAYVLSQYTKNTKGKPYRVLKLKEDGGKIFYTITYLSRDLSRKIVRIKMLPNSKISFFDYLGTFYVDTVLKESRDAPKSGKSKILNAIATQHNNAEITAFYQAIFLATTVSKRLRDKISGLGVSHLVALSGFHLTILWGLIYGILTFFYTLAQKRWFPYRFSLIDMGALTLLILWFYLWFVDYPPSLLRSYAMLLIAWILLLTGIKLISFEFLGFVVLLLLTLFPDLIVSLGFWFSVSGVFYIYLILYWSQEHGIWLSNKWVISLFSIPLGIFVLMLPVVHSVFGMTSHWQLLSPVLSLGFILFYPLVIGLHLIGMGGLLDNSLQQLFALPSSHQEHLLPLWATVVYLLLSLVAMRSLVSFGLTLGVAIFYLVYLFV